MTLYRLPRRRSLWDYLADHFALHWLQGEASPSADRLMVAFGTLPGVVFHVCPDCWPGTKGPNVIDWHCKRHALGGGDAA